MPHAQALRQSRNGRLVLTTLGRASLECVLDSGERFEVLSPGKPLGLLVYLANSPGHVATREHLADLLWADLDIEAAKHSVRQAIWFLRQRLQEDAIGATDGSVKLSATIESDRVAFLEAIERVEFERALEIYHGDFLPGFAAPGGAEFEHWADLERFRLRRLFRRAGESVVRDWMTQGRLRGAKELAARLRDAEPQDEGGWRLVLETMLAANDRVGAELEAHRLEEALAQMERPPEPATASMLALVRQAPPVSPTSTTRQTLTAELIGREREFAAILSAWESARRGSGKLVCITGAPGLGKTRLLSDVQARLQASGVRPILVRANPGERSVPYTLVSDLAAHLAMLPGAAALSPASAGALVALNPSLSARYAAPADRATDLEALRHRETALAELFGAVADEHAVALLIDDLHWADDSSRLVLAHLLSHATNLRVLVVTCARPGAGVTVGQVSGEPLTLAPLSVADTGALLASLGRLPAESWAEGLPHSLHTATRGTPLLILETLHLLLERGTLTLADGAWACADSPALAAELARGGALGRRIAELDRERSWLLLLLAAAGAPLHCDVVARAAGRDREAVESDLLGLEVRGLAMRDGREWLPAHDEIGARALELASPDALRAANAGLGRALAAIGRDDPDALHRAARHLAAAREERQLARVFTHRVSLQRRRGERRPARALAVDLLGEEASPRRVSQLLHALPLHVRIGLTSPARVAAACLATLLAAGVASFPLWRPAPPLPDVEMVVLAPIGEDSMAALVTPLRRAGWEHERPIRLRPSPLLAASGGRNDHSASPDGRSWAFSRVMKDSGEIELFVVGPDGQPERVTHSPGDDTDPSWSPDGRFLVFMTDRWSMATRTHELAVLDLFSGGVRRLTFGGGGGAVWSPDGARIAFIAAQANPSYRSLCWITPDGQQAACPDSVDTSAWIVGWDDDENVLLASDSADAHVLERVSLETGHAAVIRRDRGGIQASPDGRWVACFCPRSGFSESQWLVYPTDAPELARPLRTVIGDARPTIRWAIPRQRTAYLDSIQITPAPDTIQPRVPFHLRARGFDITGTLRPVHALVWSSDNAAIASIEPATGVLYPHREGTVRIVASAGGWRQAVHQFVVRTRAATPILEETWRDSINARWVPFGDPKPEIVAGPRRRTAFWNHGDGHFASGAYSRSDFGVSQGLAIDAELSTPVVGPRQQDVRLTLARFENEAAINRWDHRTGQAPQLSEFCSLQYAAGGGDAPWNRKLYSFGGRTFTATSAMTTGSWYAVRVQIFPDGRCGLAIDGKAIVLANDRVDVEGRYRLLLWGNSLGNLMLVGAVKVWQGVPGDLDWAGFDRRP